MLYQVRLSRNFAFEIQLCKRGLISVYDKSSGTLPILRTSLQKVGKNTCVGGVTRRFDLRFRYFFASLVEEQKSRNYINLLAAPDVQLEERRYSPNIMDTFSPLENFQKVFENWRGVDSRKEDYQTYFDGRSHNQKWQGRFLLLNEVGVFFRRRFLNLWDRNPNSFGGASVYNSIYGESTSTGLFEGSFCSSNIRHSVGNDSEFGVVSKIISALSLTISRSKGDPHKHDDSQLRVFTQKNRHSNIDIELHRVDITTQLLVCFRRIAIRGMQLFRIFGDFFFGEGSNTSELKYLDRPLLQGTSNLNNQVSTTTPSNLFSVCPFEPPNGKLPSTVTRIDTKNESEDSVLVNLEDIVGDTLDRTSDEREFTQNNRCSINVTSVSDSIGASSSKMIDASTSLIPGVKLRSASTKKDDSNEQFHSGWFNNFERTFSYISDFSAISLENAKNGALERRRQLMNNVTLTTESVIEDRMYNHFALYADSLGNLTKNLTETVPFMGNVSVVLPSISLPTFLHYNEDTKTRISPCQRVSDSGQEESLKNMTAVLEKKQQMCSCGEYEGVPSSMQSFTSYESAFQDVTAKIMESQSTPDKPQQMISPLLPKTTSNAQVVKVGHSEELQPRPVLSCTSPSPTEGDFSYLRLSGIHAGVQAAKAVRFEDDKVEFMKDVGLVPLVTALIVPFSQASPNVKIDSMKGLNQLITFDNNIADEVSLNDQVIDILIDAIEAPFKGFNVFKSPVDRAMEYDMQRESLVLIQRFIRSSDVAVSELITNERLKRALNRILMDTNANCDMISDNEEFELLVGELLNKTLMTTPHHSVNSNRTDGIKVNSKKVFQQKSIDKDRCRKDQLADLEGLSLVQMARISLVGLGGLRWEPRVTNQKGLRILSFDGGGTKGVLSLAVLDEILRRAGQTSPHEMFDIICGTSTGGIIANLLGIKRQKIADAIHLYDALIDKIFVKPSRLRLVSEQATYDAGDWEDVLDTLCGEELLLDSNRHQCARTFCVSTKLNINPPSPKIWRNYNYPVGQIPRYPGAFRVKTKTAIRASTAAPTFFTPVPWNDGLYCDGALVANNPTAIAIQEAKALFPGVPIDLVISIGTGTFIKSSNVQSMDWGLLLNQIIASSTATEDVHTMLGDLLPADQYYRFNPLLVDSFAIDEMDPELLKNLKRVAREWIEDMERTDPVRMKRLINALSGSKFT